MKNILALFILIILTCGCTFNKKEIPAQPLEVLPLISSESSSANRLWVGTFQLVWNDLMDELVKGDVEFESGTPDVVKNLNKQEFKASDLSENFYYKIWGKASFELRDTIIKDIKNKFNETSDVVGMIDWTPAPSKYVIYAMLKKDFKFLKTFDKLEPSKFGDNEQLVDYFGIKPEHNNELGKNIEVLFYNSKDNFAVKLYTQGNDIVYLYRTNDDKTFDKLYSDMNAKSEKYKGNKFWGKNDYFKVPDIKLYQEKHFYEVCKKPIIGTDFMINDAIETVNFKMNNEGVKLKSEAVLITELKSLGIDKISEPRYFYFDDTFVLFLQEKDKSKPYFALRVDDVSLINKTGK